MSMYTSERIAVIMTVHDRKAKTMNCLKQLFTNVQSNFIIDCYITDDGCTDGTVEAVVETYPQVKIISGNGSLFWNRGMLKAWQAACLDKPSYYLWLNDDTLLFDNALSKLMITSKKFEDKCIIVGSTCDNSGNLTYGGREYNRKHSIVNPDDKHCIPCKTFNGNIVLIPGAIADKIGLNDPYFHHSFGDIEYGLRATKAGVNIYIAPGFYGTCERNNPIPLFRRAKYSLVERYKLLYSPLGFNPCEDFYLNAKYYPLWKCCLWFVKLHLNVLFPKDHTKFEK